MGKWIDRATLCCVLVGAGFVYFRATVGQVWLSLALSLCLLALVIYMVRDWRKRHGRPVQRLAWRKIRLASRKNAPRCAVYGVLFMAVYLLAGQIVYLVISLGLLFIAAIGFRRPLAETA